GQGGQRVPPDLEHLGAVGGERDARRYRGPEHHVDPASPVVYHRAGLARRQLTRVHLDTGLLVQLPGRADGGTFAAPPQPGRAQGGQRVPPDLEHLGAVGGERDARRYRGPEHHVDPASPVVYHRAGLARRQLTRVHLDTGLLVQLPGRADGGTFAALEQAGRQ